MPTRDEDGKRVGGQEIKRRKEAAGLPVGSSALDFSLLFADLPPPPIGNPIGAMLWCNDALLLCMNAFMRQVAITPAELTRLRLIMDGCAKAGMIRDKSAESKAMQEALRKRQDSKLAAGLEPNASRSDPPTIPRPAG